MRMLWDLLPKRKRPPEPAPRKPARAAPARARHAEPGTMAHRYAHMTREMLDAHGVRVRKWRTSMSGCAWVVWYHDGRASRLIEAPRPKGPMSAAVFLHEIGHHAIGLGVVKPRCLEEYAAWMWALDEMRRRGLNITPRVRRRVRDSLSYAVSKGRRRGLKRVPPEIEAWIASEREATPAPATAGKPIA